MKRILCMAVLLLVGMVPAAQAVGVSATSAILIEADSGRVLYEKNADQPRLIASTTKLMTGLVALESGHDLDEMVKVSAQAAGTEGSSIYLKAGEEIRFETLLYGLMLHSGNDAAMAVAEFCAGDLDTFVEQMNEKAQKLGMEDSHFANPSGLNHEAHYATARDMARLAQACLENETLKKIVSTKQITLDGRTFTNHNKLLWRYDGCIGMKTGYTELAGRTLVSAAERDGMTLIAVTLNAPSDWADHQALFDYGFGTYQLETPIQQGEMVAYLPTQGSLIPFAPVQAAEDFVWPVRAGEQLTYELEWEQEEVTAPVEQGTQVGTLVGYLNGTEVERIGLISGTSIPAHTTQSAPNFVERLFGIFSKG